MIGVQTILATEVMLDITAPEGVEVVIKEDGKVIWVNVDGICRFRSCRIKVLDVVDKRPSSIVSPR